MTDTAGGDRELLHILQHSLGVDQYGEGRQYRKYFVTGEGSTDYPLCMDLVERGLMRRSAGNDLSGGDDVFYVTPAGIEHVAANSPKKPKLSRSKQRYEDWLSADCGLTFGEWIRSRA